jgi:pimeloyl-ACP methyl ester carboxylesterase
VRRLVVVNGVPLLQGFAWRGWARAIRAPVVGPVAVGSGYKPVVRMLARRACAPGATLGRDFEASVVRHLDLGTERALLRLLRSADPALLAAAGADLGRISAPALVLAGARDPWIAPRFAAGYAATLGDATLETIEDAGHWPWIERPEVGERMIRHLRAT